MARQASRRAGPPGPLPSRRLAARPRRTLGPVVLDLQDAVRTYPGDPPVEALRGVNLRVRQGELVDYPGVAAAKREVLELLYAEFRRRHLDHLATVVHELHRHRFLERVQLASLAPPPLPLHVSPQ